MQVALMQSTKCR